MQHGSDVKLIEDVATLAHVVKLCGWDGVGWGWANIAKTEKNTR